MARSSPGHDEGTMITKGNGSATDEKGTLRMSSFDVAEDTPQISTLCYRCLARYQELNENIRKLSAGEAKERAFDRDEKLEAAQDSKSRLKAWAMNIAALQKGHIHSSLDFRLKDAMEIRQRIIKILEELDRTINNASLITTGVKANRTWRMGYISDSEEEEEVDISEDFPETSELDQLFSTMNATNTNLMKLSMIIRDSPTRDDYLKAASRYRFDPRYDIGHVKEKYSLAKGSKDWLIERLGKSITRRRQFLKYREEHHGKLARDWDAPEDEVKPEKTITMTKATTFIETKATVVLEKPEEPEVEGSFGSQTSYDQTVMGETSVGKLTVPPPPVMAFEGVPFQYGEYFQCPYCYTEQIVKNRAAWKKHVFQDLRPYVCTFKECNMRMFRSRNEWFTHELQSHRRQWICVLCAKLFTNKTTFSNHLTSVHNIVESDSQLGALMLQSEEPVDTIPSSACPVCDEWEENILDPKHDAKWAFLNDHKDMKPYGTLKQFRRHLGRHMEQLALFALPMAESEDLEDDSAGGDFDDSASVEDGEVDSEVGEDAPETLHDEIIRVHQLLPKISFDEVDINKRTVVASMNGPWGVDGESIHIQVTMSFPDQYPESKAPNFSLARTSLIPDEVHRRLSYELRQIAGEFVSHKKGCLEAILCYLLREVDGVSAGGDFDDIASVKAENAAKIAPLGIKPRVTAQLWEDEGNLCFQVEHKGARVTGTRELENEKKGSSENLLKTMEAHQQAKGGVGTSMTKPNDQAATQVDTQSEESQPGEAEIPSGYVSPSGNIDTFPIQKHHSSNTLATKQADIDLTKEDPDTSERRRRRRAAAPVLNFETLASESEVASRSLPLRHKPAETTNASGYTGSDLSGADTELARHFAKTKDRERQELVRQEPELEEDFASLKVERRGDELVIEMNEEIRRRPATPLSPGPPRQVEYLRPVVVPPEELPVVQGPSAATDERDTEEEAALRQRLKERQLLARRFDVEPVARRQQVMYDDGVYRYENLVDDEEAANSITLEMSPNPSESAELITELEEQLEQHNTTTLLTKETDATEAESTGERKEKTIDEQLICRLCLQSFSQRHQLNTHLKILTGPFKCPVPSCPSEGFRYRKDLRRHLESKHPQEAPHSQYFCPIACCSRSELGGKGFPRSDDLNRHIRDVHSKKDEISEPPEDPQSIMLTDAVGRKFRFPFNSCNTWAGVKSLITMAFEAPYTLDSKYAQIVKHVLDGKYDLIGPIGELILPQKWEKIIKPDMSITMHMWPIPDLSSVSGAETMNELSPEAQKLADEAETRSDSKKQTVLERNKITRNKEAGDKQGIQRMSGACDNCRRKKIICRSAPGEDQCSSCARLKLKCNLLASDQQPLQNVPSDAEVKSDYISSRVAIAPPSARSERPPSGLVQGRNVAFGGFGGDEAAMPEASTSVDNQKRTDELNYHFGLPMEEHKRIIPAKEASQVWVVYEGKTRISTSLVSQKVVADLGFPYEIEGSTILIFVALSKEQIDDIIKLSNGSDSDRTNEIVTIEDNKDSREYPKKGETRIPVRHVSEAALTALGYSFEVENDAVIIQEALSQENIDEVIKLSAWYKNSEGRGVAREHTPAPRRRSNDDHLPKATIGILNMTPLTPIERIRHITTKFHSNIIPDYVRLNSSTEDITDKVNQYKTLRQNVFQDIIVALESVNVARDKTASAERRIATAEAHTVLGELDATLKQFEEMNE